MTMHRFKITEVNDTAAMLAHEDTTITLPRRYLPDGSQVGDEVVLDVLSDEDTVLGAFGTGSPEWEE